jgi:hypothetical protein
MSIYRISLPASARSILHDGVAEHLVEAGSSAEALVAVKAVSSKDMDVVWDQATITLLVQDLEGVVFTITVDAAGANEVFTYTGLADDTWEEVAEALEVLAEVTYTSSWTPDTVANKHGILLVATGSGTDDVGDKTMTATAVGPNSEALSALFFGTITSEGSSTDDLDVVVLADCPTPRVIGSYK